MNGPEAAQVLREAAQGYALGLRVRLAVQTVLAENERLRGVEERARRATRDPQQRRGALLILGEQS